MSISHGIRHILTPMERDRQNSDRKIRVTVVAPARALSSEAADAVTALADEQYPKLHLNFDPQCFLRQGHFAGSDDKRREAFLSAANDPDCDAIWFARGGYGSIRLLDGLIEQMGPRARRKAYLGYSDTGSLLGALYGAGIGSCLHAPMPSDIVRQNGQAAVRRALDVIAGRTEAAKQGTAPQAAFNLTVLAALNGTKYMPDLTGHILHLEDIGEYHYRIDRAFAQLATSDWFSRLAGVRLGRFSDIPDNDIDFGMEAHEIARHWCAVTGVPVLGYSPIGHDAENAVIAFG
ncbi:MAG: LD-carboxypeptidase [Pseudomonadota bacterium]